ncbi:hypothetical protein [Pseudonocardia nigra]|uniref:hypothetical protein n=1 Tax=Pseudonocardia nigra TaxID=1921578 RepID=UPI001C5FF82E|nr:hypothetical protein [Pseudonocardia nigra]
MHDPTLRPAQLDDTALDKVRHLEQELGCPLVAYARETPYAPLTDEQVAALQRAEAELGVRLLAFQA